MSNKPLPPQNPPALLSADNVVALSYVKPAEPLVEEINVVRLEGSYFCFDPKAAAERIEPLSFKDGNQRIIVEPDPRYGQPSILAYKVLQAVFRKITLEGKPFPATVSFTERELGRLVGRSSWGGRDSLDLTRAIRQLRRTAVRVYSVSPEGKKQKETEYDFNLFTESGIVALDGKIEAIALTLNSRIIESMRRNHFIILNWDIISELPPLSAAIYKRLYLHLSNIFEARADKRVLKFEKSYEDICREWLGGAKVWKYKADIERQFEAHIKTLSNLGFLSSFAIEKMADNSGFKLVFRPGKKFFIDYERFYKGRNARVLQFQQTADAADFHLPIELTRFFYSSLFGKSQIDDDVLNPADVEFARFMLTQYSAEEAKAFTLFGLESAKRTKFAIQNIRGLKLYMSSWEANKETRAKARAAAVIQNQKYEEDKLQSLYNEVRKRHFFDCKAALPLETLTLWESEAENAAILVHGKGAMVIKAAAISHLMKRVYEDFPFPDYESWKRSQQ